MLEKLKNNKDVIYKKTDGNVTLIYQEQLCNILEFMKDLYPMILADLNKDLDEIIPGMCKKINKNEELIVQLVFSGLMVVERNNEYYVFDISKAPSRMTGDSIADPEDIFGSRDGFVENFKDNIALIRTRVKDEKLRIDTVNIGRRSKTIISVLSLEDIHNDQMRKQLLSILETIDIDAVVSIPDLMAYFQGNNLFPSYHYVGNPTMSAERLYNGEFVIIIDRVCCAICMPTTLAYSSRMKIDNINTPIFSIIERLFVIFSTIFSISLCALLCLMTTYQRDSLSLNVLSKIKVSQVGIILPIYLEIIIVLGLFELFYLIGFRQSKFTLSSTIVLIGGLIIGENLVNSGLTGVVIMTGTAICFLLTFIVSSNVTTISALSVIRFFLLLSSLYFGMVGLVMVSILLTYHVYNQKSLGVHYLFPFIPFDLDGIHRFFLPNSSLKYNRRDKALKVKNINRRKIND